MDFNDAPEEAEFRAAARAFLEQHCSLKGVENERLSRRLSEGDYLQAAKAYQRKKAEAGFAGVTWPADWGGRGLPPIYSIIFQQEEAKFDAPSAPFAIGLGMCVPTLMVLADSQTKARYGGPALKGDEIWCQLFSEPAAGSDVAAVRTRAVKDGEDWVVNGQKVWTTGAHFCEFGLLLARTDPEAAKHKGLTMFFLDMKGPGVEVRPIKQASGHTHFNEVFFEDVRIPDAQRLGEVGGGWGAALVTLMNERLAIGGSMGPDYSEILSLARTLPSPSGEGVLLQDSAFRAKLADWVVRAEGYKLAKFRTMTALSKGQTPGAESSIGKVLTANQLMDISNSAVEALDHYGIIADDALAPMEAAFQQGLMWAPGIRIAGGTDEILKNIIAERVLGLPQDVRVDKGVASKDLPSGR